VLGGIVVAVVVGWSAAPGTAISGPIQVIAGPEDQLLSAANATYLIWTANGEAHPSRYHAYGRVRGTTKSFRLNAPGTRGWAGGLDPGDDRAVYQQIGDGGSDIYSIKLDTRRRRKLPSPVNTAKWEWGPRISDAYILFARDAAGDTSLFVFDRITRTNEKLFSRDRTRYHVVPGDVGERYATWSVCGPLTCSAHVHDTVTGVTRRIPAPDGRARYAPVVDETTGRLYFVRSGPACGAGVRLMRVPVTDLSQPQLVLASLPDGIDVDFRMTLEPVSGRIDLWFSRVRCASGQGDVYRFRDVGA
jgi:hypothetical protein